MEVLFRFMHNTPAMEKLIMQHCKVCLKYLFSLSTLIIALFLAGADIFNFVHAKVSRESGEEEATRHPEV
jgi:hypothetical protein